MNAITNHAQFTEATDGNQLAVMANLEDLVDGRNRAIGHWLDAYDGLHRTMALAAAASVGGNLGLQQPDSGRYAGSDTERTRAFLETRECRREDKATWKTEMVPARRNFEEILTKDVDRRCWSDLIKRTEFDTLFDRQAREEFEASLKDSPPVFNVENVTATFGDIWGNRREMYLRGIANVFMKMDRRFRSHDAFAIGNRLIIENAIVDGWWKDSNRRDTLHDVERIFRELDGKPPIAPQWGRQDVYDMVDGKRVRRFLRTDEVEGIVAKVSQATYHREFSEVLRNDYFRVRMFMNGNLHLWFERKDLLKQVNDLILEYYKPVEGDVGEGPSYESAPLFHNTPAKNFGAFFTSEAVAKLVIDRAGIEKGMTVLEPSAGSGVLAKAARAEGGQVTCIEIQPGLAHELRAVHGFRMVHEYDFLKLTLAEQFDRIVMNPPFDRGRDCDHVRHAYSFLKPGGRLVAIMSARAEFGTDARHKALHEIVNAGRNQWGGGSAGHWIDLPEKSFAHAGTNVNTVMLVLDKPRIRG